MPTKERVAKKARGETKKYADQSATPLTVKQRRFVEAYIADPTGYRAAIAAGYSEESAASTASKLLSLSKIAGEISRRRVVLMAKATAAQEITLGMVVSELRKIAFSDIRRVVRWGIQTRKRLLSPRSASPGGTESLTLQVAHLVPSDEIDDDTAAAISKVWVGGDGQIRIELHDKNEALLALGKHFGMRGGGASIGRIGDNVLNANGSTNPLPRFDLSKLPRSRLEQLDEWCAELAGDMDGADEDAAPGEEAEAGEVIDQAASDTADTAAPEE